MNHDDFSRYARFPTAESLRLDEVVVRARNETFHMNGSLRIVEQTFVLDLVLRERLSLEHQGIGEWLRRLWRRCFGTPRSETRDLPRIGGFVGASQFWNVNGIIENSLRFHCRTVPSSHRLSLGEISSRGARFEVSRLSLTHDPMTHEQTSQLISRLNNPEGNVRERILDSSFSEDNPLGDVAFEFRSVIPRVKPLWKTSFTETVETNEYLGSSTVTRRDTLTGHASDYEFALIERGEDMELHMRYRPGQDGSEEAARARFSALAQAVAFTHGCEPWFQRFEVHRGVQRIEDIVTARQFVPKTNYNLLSERVCSNGADLADAITRAADFFTENSATSQRIESLLHIARQAGAAHVPFNLGVLGLCTVFEGVVSALFEEAKLRTATLEKSPDLHSFEKARQDALSWLATKPDDAGYKRLTSRIKDLDALRNLEKSIALSDYFGIDWNSVLKPAFDAWSAERNPGAHGSYRQENDESAMFARLCNKSRIAGGINLLVAKRMGYSGLAIRSVLEEQFIRL